MGRRIIFDVSSILRWLGPPVGIMRREHELACHALAKRPDVTLSLFDPLTTRFHAVNPAWAHRLVSWEYALDLVTFDVRRWRRGLSRVRPSRYPVTMALEGWRLSSCRPAVRQVLDLAQRLLWLLPHGLPPPFTDGRGSRFGVVPIPWALGSPLYLGPGDTILSVGDDWFHKQADKIGGLKRRDGFRYVVMCQDLIPIMFPAFFPSRDADLFQRHWSSMLGIADLVLVNSYRVETDIRDYCRKLGIDAPSIARVKPGLHMVPADRGFSLPAGVKPGRFILFVATIEPRKGHAMLLDVWQRLLADGVPQRHGFKLVLVGRPGWHVETLLARIADSAEFRGSLLHLVGLEDRAVARLYQDAAFCVLPSLYEGFGLPVIEAFAHGRAIVVSTGGSLPEVAGDLAPALSPTDPDAWYAMIGHWIENESARRAYEDRIRRFSTPIDWDEASAEIFEMVDRMT